MNMALVQQKMTTDLSNTNLKPKGTISSMFSLLNAQVSVTVSTPSTAILRPSLVLLGEVGAVRAVGAVQFEPHHDEDDYDAQPAGQCQQPGHVAAAALGQLHFFAESDVGAAHQRQHGRRNGAIRPGGAAGVRKQFERRFDIGDHRLIDNIWNLGNNRQHGNDDDRHPARQRCAGDHHQSAGLYGWHGGNELVCNTPAWLMSKAGLSATKMQKLEPYITLTRTNVYKCSSGAGLRPLARAALLLAWKPWSIQSFGRPRRSCTLRFLSGERQRVRHDAD